MRWARNTKLIAATLIVAAMLHGLHLIADKYFRADIEQSAVSQRMVSSPKWKTDFDNGFALFQQDSVKASALIETGLKECAKDTKVAERMGMFRKYANLLYDYREYDRADRQIQKAIDICISPKPNSAEADELTQAYQDRGWADHSLWLNNHTKNPGDKDQALSVSLAEKYFGADHRFTIAKVAALAVIYADLGQQKKARELMQRALKDTDAKPGNNEKESYIHALNARIMAVDHDYKAAVKEFLTACSLAKGPSQRSRAWSELNMGLRSAQMNEPACVQLSEAYIKRKQFAQLDQLMNRLRTDRTPTSIGRWVLDLVYEKITLGGYNKSENEFSQRILELQKWLKQNPNSVSARIALAGCYINYAWKAQEDSHLGSISERDDREFDGRLVLAKATLDADPAIRKKCPRAFRNYNKIAIGQDMDKSTFLQQQDECHKEWPDYHYADVSACLYLLPDAHGEYGEAEQYIATTSNLTPGVKGDERCAQLVWETYEDIPNLCRQGSPVTWARVNSGFKQILTDFPSDLYARIGYIKVAGNAGQLSTLTSVFDGYKTKVVETATH